MCSTAKTPGHHALVNDYQRSNSLQAALSSHHMRKCYINKMEGPHGPLPNMAPTATACHPTFSICVVAWWEQSPKAGEVNSARLIKKPLEVHLTCVLYEIFFCSQQQLGPLWHSMAATCGIQAGGVFFSSSCILLPIGVCVFSCGRAQASAPSAPRFPLVFNLSLCRQRS